MAVERRPLDVIAQQQNAYKSKISAYGVVKSALSALQIAVKALTRERCVARRWARHSRITALATIATGAGAVAGANSIEVATLAQAHKVASAGFAAVSDSRRIRNAHVHVRHLVRRRVHRERDRRHRDGRHRGRPVVARGHPRRGERGKGRRHRVHRRRRQRGRQAAGVHVELRRRHEPQGRLSPTTTALRSTPPDFRSSPTIPRARRAPAATSRRPSRRRTRSLTIDGIAISKPTERDHRCDRGRDADAEQDQRRRAGDGHDRSDPKNAVAAVEAFIKRLQRCPDDDFHADEVQPRAKAGSVLTGDVTARTIQSRLRSLAGGTISGGATSGSEITSLSHIGVKSAVDGTLTLDSAKLFGPSRQRSAGRGAVVRRAGNVVGRAGRLRRRHVEDPVRRLCGDGHPARHARHARRRSGGRPDDHDGCERHADGNGRRRSDHRDARAGDLR